jgi:hypothetical protein
MSDDNMGEENPLTDEVQPTEEETSEKVIVEKAENETWKYFFGIKRKPFKTRFIEMNETAKPELEKIYKSYLDNSFTLSSAQNKVLRIEYDFEVLVREYKQTEPEPSVDMQDKQFTNDIIDRIRENIDFHKRKLHMHENGKAPAAKGKKDSDTTPGDQDGSSIVKTEEIPIETPAVIVDLIKKSGMVEAERDVKGRFHPKGTYKDTDIIGWIVEYSKHEKNLTAAIYSQYIYTKVQQSTLEKYISTARNF